MISLVGIKNSDLKNHIQRIISNFTLNPDNLKDSLPNKSEKLDDGEGNDTWYLDVPNIEESYFYANVSDRDSDYKLLVAIINKHFAKRTK